MSRRDESWKYGNECVVEGSNSLFFAKGSDRIQRKGRTKKRFVSRGGVYENKINNKEK